MSGVSAQFNLCNLKKKKKKRKKEEVIEGSNGRYKRTLPVLHKVRGQLTPLGQFNDMSRSIQ